MARTTKQSIQLSDHFTYSRLLRFTAPSVVMLVFCSLYGVVDGFFVSNFVGKTAFTAVNFIMPFLMMMGAIGFLFGTGGGALIAKTMGEGDNEMAKRQFSLVVYVSLGMGVLLAVLGLVFLEPCAALLGAEGEMLEYSVRYGRIILLSIPAYVLQYEFQCLFASAQKPKLGLYVTVAAGLTNMVLDALFVAGSGGGCRRDSSEPVRGRFASAGLFRKAEYESAAPDAYEVDGARSAAGVYKRFLGTPFQYLHVDRQHAV